MTKALADLGAEPVTTLINTHWHFDHTDGNAWLNSVGAKIIAQENTLKFLERSPARRGLGLQFCLPRPGGMPTETFADALISSSTANRSNSSIMPRPYRQRHFRDLCRSEHRACRRYVLERRLSVHRLFHRRQHRRHDRRVRRQSRGDDADTIIIAGHGQPVSNKAELQQFRDMLVGVRENVATLKRQGRTRDEIVAAKPTAAFDAKFGDFVIDPGFFTRLVYEGV